MTVIQITCDNCGAKYKLPETFTGSQAKCQKCGSVIDVQKQRPAAAGAAPAAVAAKPAAAAARPAVDRSKEAPKVDRPARPARAGKADAGADDGTKGRRGGREKPEAKKSNNMPLVLGGVGLLAVIVVVVLMMRGGDKAKTDTTAKTDTNAKTDPSVAAKPTAQPTDKPTDKPAPVPTDKPPEKTTEAAAKPADKPAEQPAEKPAEAPAAKPPEAAPTDASTAAADAATKRPWEKMKNPPASMAEVADPKSYGEVKWPESVDEATRTEIRGLVDDVKNGGRAGITAKPKLVKHDYAALFGIVDGLRALDYKSAEDSMVAFELNKVLEQVTGGLNARFEPVEAGEELAPAKAEWNTRSVKGWLGMLDQFPDAETFRKGRAERLKKQEAK